jgi:sigma-B regulation protein RsbU (phosphoserine phosphatase)
MIYDARDGSVLIANAGHPKPLLDGEPVEIKGLPLGVSPRTAYREVKVGLAPGASLVIYSDGLEDVENESGEQFGPARVLEFFSQQSRAAPEEARERLGLALAAFAGRAEAADDQTVIVLQRSLTAALAPAHSGTQPLAL